MTPRSSWTGKKNPTPAAKPLREMTITEALTDRRPPPTGPAATPPAALMGGGMLPAPLLAAKIAGTAKIVPIRHPGDTATAAPLHPHRGTGHLYPVPGYDVPLPRLR